MADAQDGRPGLDAGEEFRLVIVSAPDADCGAGLAKRAVQERLAACVTQIPSVQSTYRWEGKVEVSEEVLLLFKTSLARLEGLAEWIQKNHPYDVPEFLSFAPAEVDRAYGAWLAHSCSAGD